MRIRVISLISLKSNVLKLPKLSAKSKLSLGNAQIKIVANAGDNIQGGVNSVMDLFTAKGGQSVGAMLEAFAGTEQGRQLLSKLFGKPEEKTTEVKE